MLAHHWAPVQAAKGPAGTGGLELGNAGASVRPDGGPWEGRSLLAMTQCLKIKEGTRHLLSRPPHQVHGHHLTGWHAQAAVTLLTFSFLFVEDAPLTQTVSKIRSSLISIQRGG